MSVKKILIVDPQGDWVLNLANLVFHTFTSEILVAQSTEEAGQVLSENQVSVVIVRAVAPVGTAELIRSLRSCRSGLKFILITPAAAERPTPFPKDNDVFACRSTDKLGDALKLC